MTARPLPVPRDARVRIVEAGIRCIVQEGIDASMATIAAEGGVSKALLHYHFAGRAELLAEVAGAIGRRLAVRERAIILGEGGADGPVDAMWKCVRTELERGELRALLALGMARHAGVQQAVRAVHVQRRAIAAASVERIFDRLGLTLRIPAALVAEASVAFVDGLALDVANGDRDARVSFDVFWLGMLGLGD